MKVFDEGCVDRTSLGKSFGHGEASDLSENDTDGTLLLSLGRFFKARGVLIIVCCQSTIQNGVPLFLFSSLRHYYGQRSG